MTKLRELVYRLRGFFQPDPAQRLDEELAVHAELLASGYVEQGMTEADARRAAHRELGNVTTLRQNYREQNSLPLVENFWLDFKYALRTLRRNPAFSAACIATLAIGLAAMITVLCVVSAFVWKPVPYSHPESLVVVNEVDPRGGIWPFSQPALLDLQQRSRSLSSVAAYRTDSLSLAGTGSPEAIQCAWVTPSFLNVLGITPLAGTGLQNSEPLVVISRRLWQRRWQQDPLILGQSVSLNGVHYSIAGIAAIPADLLPNVDLLLPLTPNASESRSAHEIQIIARLAPGFLPSRAQAEMNNIAQIIAREHVQTNAGWTLRILPLANYLVSPATSRMVWMVFASVALLWALACTNVASLQLARNVSRRFEMTTRLALGAGRGRLLMQTLTESLVLASVGSLLGLVLAQFAVEAIRAVPLPALPQLARLQIDISTVLVAAACMLLSTVLFGVVSGRAPAWQSSRPLTRRERGRDALIVTQVALASILLLAATLLFQSFLRLQAVYPGFDTERILTVRISLPSGDQASVKRLSFMRDSAQQLAALPAVESVSASNVLPFSGYGTANRFRTESDPSSEYHSAAWRAVTPGFFKTLGIPLKQGRFLNDTDLEGSLEVVVISESMARQFWPNQNPVGKRLLWGRSGNPKTIVGVVADLRDLALDQPPIPTMFRPFAQLSDPSMTLLIRTRHDSASVISDVRRCLQLLDSSVAVEPAPLREVMSNSILRPWASFLAVAAFSCVALITAALGLYATISYRVNQRQQEIGVRLALGARPAMVHWLIQRRSLFLVLAGTFVGLPCAFALATLVRTVLYETEPAEPISYLAVILAFSLVSLIASFGPALRASRLDPSTALRHE